MSVKADLAKILLTSPACTEIGEKVALSRRIDKHWVRAFSAPYSENRSLTLLLRLCWVYSVLWVSRADSGRALCVPNFDYLT